MLLTKLNIPPSPAAYVARPKLFNRLNAGLACRLTLVCAPAGFGKTALVSQWLSDGLDERLVGRVAWLSLDASDNLANQFWQYLIAALQTIDAALGQASLAALAESPLEAVLTHLINEIAQDGAPLVLCLDDYHEIRTLETHQGIAFLLKHAPANLHLVIVSREDPPLSTSRLRVRGQLCEVRADDLRFTLPETAALMNELGDLDLGEGDIRSLSERTEGWIAGLQLAAISLRGADNRGQFIQDFAGSHRFLAEYLVDEVLARQEATALAFLRRTAVLDRFCADLCDALVDDVDGAAILDQLYRANLFLQPLDYAHRWYRYHHLFAELLRMQLEARDGDMIPDLYRRAARWFSEHGDRQEALRYALLGGELELAADLVETLAPDVLGNEHHGQVIQWVGQLPDEIVRRRPRLMAHLGWAWTLVGQMQTAAKWLDQAQALCEDASPGCPEDILGEIAAHRAYAELMNGRTVAARRYAQDALRQLPADALVLRGRAVRCLGQAHIYAGRLAEAQQAFGEAIDIARRIGSLTLGMLSYTGLGEAQREAGLHDAVLATYNEAMAYCRDTTGSDDAPMTGYVQVAIGVMACERGDLADAVEQIEHGIALCRAWQLGEGEAVGLLELAEAHRLGQDYDRAADALAQAERLVTGMSSWARRLTAGFAARLALSRGDLRSAQRWAEQSGLLEHEGPLDFTRFSELLPFFQVLIATGQAERSLAMIDILVDRERACGRLVRLTDLLVHKAAAHSALGAEAEALAALGEAVRIAQRPQLVRPFLDHANVLVPILERLPASAFRDALLERLGGTAPSASAEPKALVEPLSDREIAILRLMSAGRSNREIGDAMYLSVNTIRWYASQMYAKLGCKSRGQAVAIARDKGLL